MLEALHSCVLGEDKLVPLGGVIGAVVWEVLTGPAPPVCLGGGD